MRMRQPGSFVTVTVTAGDVGLSSQLETSAPQLESDIVPVPTNALSDSLFS